MAGPNKSRLLVPFSKVFSRFLHYVRATVLIIAALYAANRKTARSRIIRLISQFSISSKSFHLLLSFLDASKLLSSSPVLARNMHKPILCNRRVLRPTNDITSSVTNVEVIRCCDSADTGLFYVLSRMFKMMACVYTQVDYVLSKANVLSLSLVSLVEAKHRERWLFYSSFSINDLFSSHLQKDIID